MKPTIWVFAIEPLESRYTKQWHDSVPKLLEQKYGDKYQVMQVDGVQRESTVTPGAFLNFADTNFWKSTQLCNFLELHAANKTSPNDHFLFTDAWNPIIMQLRYISDLMEYNWVFHGLHHAGRWDPEDFLGRMKSKSHWAVHAERSMYQALDHNYFATSFHAKMYCDYIFGLDGYVKAFNALNTKKIVRASWPMEYLTDALGTYKIEDKEDLIVFPHRIAPEKQVAIFRDLATELPQYKFVVCQDQSLTKSEYHNILRKAKIVFSANLQETLGISTCAEGPVLGAIPLAPHRLSYIEIFSKYPEFLYPSEWTIDFAAYTKHKAAIAKTISTTMENYSLIHHKVVQYVDTVYPNFFETFNLEGM